MLSMLSLSWSAEIGYLRENGGTLCLSLTTASTFLSTVECRVLTLTLVETLCLSLRFEC